MKIYYPMKAKSFKQHYYFLGRTYFKFGWIQQFHLGAMRNNNSRMYKLLGSDSGWDSIGQYHIATSLSNFFK